MSDLTRAEAIKELTEHHNHWKRLLKEGICGKEQGERTIKSLELAIDSLKIDSTIKEAYDKGYKDGQEALAVHLELCEEEEEPRGRADMLRKTNYGLWINDDGKPSKNEEAIDYIVESARSVGIKVIEGKTALDIQFMAEVMKRLREKQEPCEDAISRQAVEEIINDIRDCISIEGYCAILERMKKLPPVTPKPKTDVFDKIRAEIKEVQTYKMFEGEDTVYVERKDILAIIDKYKAESEDEKYVSLD